MLFTNGLLPVRSGDELCSSIFFRNVIQGNENREVERFQFHYDGIIISSVRTGLAVQVVSVSVPGSILLFSN